MTTTQEIRDKIKLRNKLVCGPKTPPVIKIYTCCRCGRDSPGDKINHYFSNRPGETRCKDTKGCQRRVRRNRRKGNE